MHMAFALLSALLLIAPTHDPELRIRALHQRIRHEPTNAQLYLERGDLYRKIEAYDRALADLRRAAELDPALHTAHLLLAMTLLRVAQPAAALAAVEEFSRRVPGHGGALLLRTAVGLSAVLSRIPARADVRAATRF